MMTRIERVMIQFGCDEADAQRYIELREEGYNPFQAEVIAGLSDPCNDAESVPELPVTAEEDEAFDSMNGELR